MPLLPYEAQRSVRGMCRAPSLPASYPYQNRHSKDRRRRLHWLQTFRLSHSVNQSMTITFSITRPQPAEGNELVKERDGIDGVYYIHDLPSQVVCAHFLVLYPTCGIQTTSNNRIRKAALLQQDVEMKASRDVRLAHFCGVLAVVALRRPFC
ncbi:hypothetical protein C349_03886 [Cryptococcus neoformans var. grubii Br795]|uniref:Uncharacterized protein n=1 Tax=Cryptococcus neoformans Tu259-1 TaxID=1230072 RepID=A0A854QDC1_CRYNE|nr:hypothetical protein C353_03863 [Cryptococcus neoformans var. grubii AD1-83a]OWZ53580.1 hypothetical protein C368_03955 [Cryptococcus neoformans var. grubii 125.91]OXG20101.1 hypothetical protein C361_04163 [Cryptococcus neoformans var. grubii Tu259-1]OXG40284.1 hypothetical protein C360_00049 [Cryptococcus neoformans var. grubii Bt15]OXG49166.1 hypothetical protein C355_03666 [Cryptococcus neoformans var. grubii Th84]OXG57352.1 hypothetical protein C354_03796 [Cryptococcus neoformans var. 